jgi:glycosyltransferase involved in cell wall biosynthesis
MKISICIPVWEQHGRGHIYLNELLNTILKQSYKNFNVILSDHSLNSEIEKIYLSYKDILDITYFKNPFNRGNGPANTNKSIINADGEIVKIMFQDDFFYQKNSLELIAREFEDKNCNWLVNGCNHTNDDGKTFERFMIPTWNDNIPYGVNTISSPSVLAFRNENLCLFDENLEMLMDCEMYYQLYLKFGLPKILSEPLITNRGHQFQISTLYKKDVNKEINYIKKKYNL